MRGVLEHIYLNYGRVTPNMMMQADAHMRQAFNLLSPLEDFFEQFNTAQNLCEAGGNPYSDAQLINVAYDAIFKTAVHNNTCKKWICLPPTNKTWANVRLHFTTAHRYFHKMQQNAAQARFTTNFTATDNIHTVNNTTADALKRLATATEEDKSTVSNLTNINSQLVEQVINLTKQVDKKMMKLSNYKKASRN
eukprot:15353182-Ditylum_brightwellii.AAC.1